MGSHDQHCSSHSDCPYYMDTRYKLYGTTPRPRITLMARPVLVIFYWLPWVLLPRESWFLVIPRHSTSWLYWFPYSVSNAVRVKYRKGTYSVTIVISVPWDMGTSTAFLPVIWTARFNCFFLRNLRCEGEAGAYIDRGPSHFGSLCFK